MSSTDSATGKTGPILRRLGDAAVVFDSHTWETHLLPPAAAAVADLIDELAEEGPVTMARVATALRAELELESDTPQIEELLRMLNEIGMLDT